MGKSGNQKFTYLPYDMLMGQLVYKCQDSGINFIKTEESYTSGTSFLDGEIPCKENYDKSRRIQRGLFQADTQLVNSDVNGSLQILRKVFPDAFGYGIEGSLMLKSTFVIAESKESTTGLMCSCCGSSLGTQTIIDGKQYSDVDGWEYCPYCGSELYDL